MKKSIILIFLTITLTLCSCNSFETSEKGFTFTDDLGRTVTVNSIKRVAALLGSYADLWILAGGDICAAADDAWDDFSLDLAEDTINIGSTHAPNKDALLLAAPDFVIASSKILKHIELKETFDSAGITVAYFDVGNFDDFMRVFKILTDINERPDLFEIHGQNQKMTIDNILQESKNKPEKSVLVMRASATSIRAKNSDSTMLGGMLADFGCKNIADSNNMILENLNIESIIEKNPDIIFFIQTGNDMQSIKENVDDMIADNPLWQELDAIKNGKIYYMEKVLYNLKPNANFSKAYEKLEKILYEQ